MRGSEPRKAARSVVISRSMIAIERWVDWNRACCEIALIARPMSLREAAVTSIRKLSPSCYEKSARVIYFASEQSDASGGGVEEGVCRALENHKRTRGH